NRSGLPLLEIVSEPDLREPAEAVTYLKAIQTLVRYLRVSDGNMEEGSLRCDANVSVRPRGAAELGAKVEIKNMNSFRAVERALTHEAARQREALGRDETIAQETRLYDEAAGGTRPMRGKEEAHDYRYFPEPDLPVFTADEEFVAPLRKALPELPAARQARFASEYGLPAYDVEVLTADRATADWFEEAVGAGAPPKAAGNWVMTELLGKLNAAGHGLADAKVGPAQLAELLRLIEDGTISGKIAKEVFAVMYETGKDPQTVVAEGGLVQITDEGVLGEAVRAALAANPASVADYKAGKKQAVGFLVGQVMKATGGKANPQKANELVKEELDKA
ncbi:MAG: Asp-tRNA(Asn)/Glu-tRNA(Gln) amidotransferase subunit GatB, partial [bacterium]